MESLRASFIIFAWLAATAIWQLLFAGTALAHPTRSIRVKTSHSRSTLAMQTRSSQAPKARSSTRSLRRSQTNQNKKLLKPSKPKPLASLGHEETKRVMIVIRDLHGKKHRVFKNQTVWISDKAYSGKSSTAKQSAYKAKTHLEAKSSDRAAPETNQGLRLDEQATEEGQTMPERINPNFGKAYSLYDEGVNARLRGDFSSAIDLLSKGCLLVPDNARGGPPLLKVSCEYELAQAAEAKGDLPQAARYYKNTIADRPNSIDAAVKLCFVLARMKDYAAALAIARTTVENNESDPRAHLLFSVMLEKTGSAGAALAEKKKLAALISNLKNQEENFKNKLSTPDSSVEVNPNNSQIFEGEQPDFSKSDASEATIKLNRDKQP